MEMRQWLWQALRQVMLHGAYSNLYLKDHLSELSPKDRALATRIFYGTLQNAAFCEANWKRFAKSRVSGSLGVLLTFSVYQLLFLDRVPAYAVVDDAVKLARSRSKDSAGFVNAILRSVQAEPLRLPEDEVERLALETSLPLWMIRMWKKQYGWDATKMMAKASTCTLPVYVRRNPLRLTDEKAREKGLVPASDLEAPMNEVYIYPGDGLEMDQGYVQGEYSVQDPGSYAIVRMAGPQPGDIVLDVCAAPGTKTMAMAEEMQGNGSITALDLHEHRVKLIEADAKRLGFEDIITAQAQDATDLSNLGEFDVVLCDVPCSGYGVLARKPDMKLHLSMETMDTLIPLQKQLLNEAARHVKPGGRLVYSTCTMNKKENEKQVEAFLKTHEDFRLQEEKSLLPDEKRNGFYMAELLRLPGKDVQ